MSTPGKDSVLPQSAKSTSESVRRRCQHRLKNSVVDSQLSLQHTSITAALFGSMRNQTIRTWDNCWGTFFIGKDLLTIMFSIGTSLNSWVFIPLSLSPLSLLSSTRYKNTPSLQSQGAARPQNAMDTESEKPVPGANGNKSVGGGCPGGHMSSRTNGIVPGKSAAMEWLENPQICPGAVGAAAGGVTTPSSSRLRGVIGCQNQEQLVSSNGGGRVTNAAPGSAQPSQVRLNDFMAANQSVAYPPPFASSSRAVNR